MSSAGVSEISKQLCSVLLIGVNVFYVGYVIFLLYKHRYGDKELEDQKTAEAEAKAKSEAEAEKAQAKADKKAHSTPCYLRAHAAAGAPTAGESEGQTDQVSVEMDSISGPTQAPGGTQEESPSFVIIMEYQLKIEPGSGGRLLDYLKLVIITERGCGEKREVHHATGSSNSATTITLTVSIEDANAIHHADKITLCALLPG